MKRKIFLSYFLNIIFVRLIYSGNFEERLFNDFKNNKTENILNYINKGISINYQDKIGSSLLHYAIRWGNFAVCEFLISSKNFDINLVDIYGNTPFHSALNHFYSFVPSEDIWINYSSIAYHKKEILELFFSRPDLDLNIQDNYGCTVLHTIILNRDHKLFKLIMTKNINLDIQDNWGNTALHYAVKNGDLNEIKLLIQSGANYKIKNKLNKTPQEIAREKSESKNCLLPNFVNKFLNQDYIIAYELLDNLVK